MEFKVWLDTDSIYFTQNNESWSKKVEYSKDTLRIHDFSNIEGNKVPLIQLFVKREINLNKIPDVLKATYAN